MNLDTASFDSVFSLIESAAAVGSVAASSWAFEALGYKRNERLSNGTKNGILKSSEDSVKSTSSGSSSIDIRYHLSRRLPGKNGKGNAFGQYKGNSDGTSNNGGSNSSNGDATTTTATTMTTTSTISSTTTSTGGWSD